MSNNNIDSMNRAWDRILEVCDEEGLNLGDMWHLFKSMVAWLEDVL